MTDNGNRIPIVIHWLTGWIWEHTPDRQAKCRGCGEDIPRGTPSFMYIYGFHQDCAQRGCLCLECGEAVLQAIIEKAAGSLPDESRTAIVAVEGGTVQDVMGLPPGWKHRVCDRDDCRVCGGLDDECENCRWPDGPAWSGDG